MLAKLFRANPTVRISRGAPHRGAGRNCPENWPPRPVFCRPDFPEARKINNLKMQDRSFDNLPGDATSCIKIPTLL